MSPSAQQSRYGRARRLLPALTLALLCVLAVSLVGCGSNQVPLQLSLRVTGPGGLSKALSAKDLSALPQAQALYTSVNNWPSAKQYAAKGISVTGLLKQLQIKAGTVVTFEAKDGYQVALTYEQLTQTRYSFAGGKRVKVEPILAYNYAQDATSLGQMKTQGTLTLVFGQQNATEHTNPAFISGVERITISDAVPSWQPPTIFPSSAIVSAGETVKLVAPDAGQSFVYYTLDGSTPTISSKLYNPSTYQPQLNKPIPITQDTTIKAITIGYGKDPSSVATFQVKVR